MNPGLGFMLRDKGEEIPKEDGTFVCEVVELGDKQLVIKQYYNAYYTKHRYLDK